MGARPALLLEEPVINSDREYTLANFAEPSCRFFRFIPAPLTVAGVALIQRIVSRKQIESMADLNLARMRGKLKDNDIDG